MKEGVDKDPETSSRDEQKAMGNWEFSKEPEVESERSVQGPAISRILSRTSLTP